MNIRKFVSETLVQIQQGISDAQKQLTSVHEKGAVNPVWGTLDDVGRDHIKEIEFDIAVAAAEETETTGGAGLTVVGVKVGGGKSKSVESSSVSRVRFSVPFIPPIQLVKRSGDH